MVFNTLLNRLRYFTTSYSHLTKLHYLELMCLWNQYKILSFSEKRIYQEILTRVWFEGKSYETHLEKIFSILFVRYFLVVCKDMWQISLCTQSQCNDIIRVKEKHNSWAFSVRFFSIDPYNYSSFIRISRPRDPTIDYWSYEFVVCHFSSRTSFNSRWTLLRWTLFPVLSPKVSSLVWE